MVSSVPQNLAYTVLACLEFAGVDMESSGDSSVLFLVCEYFCVSKTMLEKEGLTVQVERRRARVYSSIISSNSEE